MPSGRIGFGLLAAMAGGFAIYCRNFAQHFGYLLADALKALLQGGAADNKNIIAARRELGQMRGRSMTENPFNAVTHHSMAQLFGSRKANADFSATPAGKTLKDKSRAGVVPSPGIDAAKIAPFFKTVIIRQHVDAP